ncbi:MAG TPA: glycerol-3-phosphate 1-O-acyltransferase PlsY [Pyrinomonadaceae bacterium]|nr:glycerol-3-phosphate 1-O-acyltransferase PlsY [Pyrinomonadaceae bacterium]
MLPIIVAYVIGSIPFGYLIVRATQGADVRETGSGGIGATNVSRRAGKLAGVLPLLLDAVKGATAIVLANVLLGVPVFDKNATWWIGVAGIAALIGHIFPVWLGFRGGKGVATGVGVFVMLAPTALGFAAIIFTVTVLLTRYVSLGSILAAIGIPIVILTRNYFSPQPNFPPLLFAATVGAALIVFAHRENIGRLIQGTERKFK